MNLIFPSVFEKNQKVKAVFTESNRHLVQPGSRIDGLNLGTNTSEPPEIIRENTQALFKELKWNYSKLASADQVHGTDIEIIDKPGVYEETDGLITNNRDLVLGIRVADCAAVLMADPVQGIAGAFHAGWKGAAGGIVIKGIKKMMELSGDPENFLVYISPCISLKNFEVGDEVASEFPEQFVDRGNFSKPHVDLKSFIMSQCLDNGVPAQQIEVSMECTMQSTRFYSYRRDGGEAGRMLGLIKLEN